MRNPKNQGERVSIQEGWGAGEKREQNGDRNDRERVCWRPRTAKLGTNGRNMA